MDPERLREKAEAYELSRLAAEERGDSQSALGFGLVALVLYELAESILDDDREAA